MSRNIFRKEAIDARNANWLGTVSLAQPMPIWVLTLAAIFMAATLATILVCGTYTRRTAVLGRLVPDLGLAMVVAPTAGVVSHVYEAEGAQVRSGNALVRINTPRVTSSGSDVLEISRENLRVRNANTMQISAFQVAQLDAQIAGTNRQLAAARLEQSQLNDEIVSRREQVRIGRETAERYEKVAIGGYVSLASLDQQRQSVLDLVNAQKALERQASALRRNIALLEQAEQELPTQLEALKAMTRRDLAALDQEHMQMETTATLQINAPISGLLVNRTIEAGQAVQPGQVLMKVLPSDSQLQAQLLIPSRAIGFIEVGDVVLIRYQAFPYQKFGHHQGRVSKVSRSALNANEIRALNDDLQVVEPLYRVSVELDVQGIAAYGKVEPLKPGMLLDAEIMGEKRRLFEWVIEPLMKIKRIAT